MRRLPIAAGLAATLACACSVATDSNPADETTSQSFPLLSPVRPEVTLSGLFRNQSLGVTTRTVPLTPESEFLATGGTIATMENQGLYLVDVGVENTTTSTHQFTGVFQSNVPATQHFEMTKSNFEKQVAVLNGKGVRLIGLRTYLRGSVRYYFGIFQAGSASQLYGTDLDRANFDKAVANNAAKGYHLTNLEVFVTGGQERFLGVWRSRPQNTASSLVFVGGFNALARELINQLSANRHLVTMTSWEFSGDRRYAGVFLDGAERYEVVAATSPSVFARKLDEMSALGKEVFNINIEHGYQPPVGLAASFNNHLDGAAVGYSYSISEKGVTTAMGGFGYARAAWETQTPRVVMSEKTRMDVASVTKAVALAAIYKLLEDRTVAATTNLDTPIMSILGTSALNGGTAGQGVGFVTIRDLVNMKSGLYAAPCDSPYFTNYSGWLGCVLQQYTRNNPGAGDASSYPYSPPAQVSSNYSNTDFGVLRGVIERISKKTFEAYLHEAIFLPLGVNTSSGGVLGLTNGNCNPDLTTATRPLYYQAGQTSGTGSDEQGRARDLAVCGAGGMQLTSAQLNRFMSGVTHNNFFQPNTLSTMLHSWALQPLQTIMGPAFAKNGGYTIANGQGPVADIVMFTGTDTQISVIVNTSGSDANGVSRIDPQAAIVDGYNLMYTYARNSIAVINRNNVTYGNMCFDVEGGAMNNDTRIIQWTCGSAPMPANRQFYRIDLGNGLFNLQSMISGKCVTIQFADSAPGRNVIQYDCNGGSNQAFAFRATSGGFGQLIAQNSGLCLTVDGNSSGIPILQQPCLNSDLSSQEFVFQQQP